MKRLAPAEQRVDRERRVVRRDDPPHNRLVWLQTAAGNKAVSGLISSAHTETIEPAAITVEAVIPYRPADPRSGRQADTSGVHFDRDSEIVGVDDESGPAYTSGASEFIAHNLAVGQGVTLPDTSVTIQTLVDTDSLSGAIRYSPTVTQAGVVNPFGATSWSTFSATGRTVTRTPGAFAVTFNLNNPITFNVTSPKPSIASDTDAAITAGNWRTVASDLTPNMAHSQSGRPPRTRFWARDLTIQHERFHCTERANFAAAGTVQAQAWLGTRTAGSLADVAALIAQVPNRVITYSMAAVGTLDQKESRAYGDGAPSYQNRADAIRARGAAGDYR